MKQKQQAKIRKISEVSLAILECLAIISIAAIAPNALQIIELFRKKDERLKTRNPESIRRNLYRLEKKRLVKILEKDGQTIIEITENGKKRILQNKIEEIRIQAPIKWDGKWRLVLFDIPNTKTLARNIFRDKLRQLGFYLIQRSIWIFPYPCKDEIDFIKETYEVGPYVQVVEANYLEDEARYLKIFNLKKS